MKLYFYRPIGLFVVNFFFQRVLRIDADFIYPKNFTSRVLVGKNIIIENNCTKVMKSFAVSSGCYFHAHENINIGEGTIWSNQVSLITLDHNKLEFDQKETKGEINIGRNCWIGVGVTILGGVSLADNIIVGANSVVNKTFTESNIVIAGSPAKIVKRFK